MKNGKRKVSILDREAKSVVPEASEPDEKSKAMATLMLDRQERMQRCGNVIDEVLKKERCTLFAPLAITEDGRVMVPSIQIKAME